MDTFTTGLTIADAAEQVSLTLHIVYSPWWCPNETVTLISEKRCRGGRQTRPPWPGRSRSRAPAVSLPV